MKILLIAGHGAGDPGAVGNGYNEADLAREFVTLLKLQLDKYADVTMFDLSKNPYEYFKTISFNFKEYDYVLEVHFNSYKEVAANGVEILVHPAEKSVGVENAIINYITDLGFKNRGVKTRTDLRNMNVCKGQQGVSYALLEVCFISNKHDMQMYVENKSDIVKAAARGIIEGFKLSQSVLQTSSWATDAFNKATDKGVLDGTNPQGAVTREMLAVVLERMGIL